MRADQQVTFGPRRGGRWRWCLLSLLAAALLAATLWPGLIPDVAVGPGSVPGKLMVALGAGLLLLVGLARVLAIVRDVPRLTLDHDGIVLRTLFRTTSVPWLGLGQFSLRAAGWSGDSQRFEAIAPIVGPFADVGPASGSLSIPDVFDAPFALVVHAIAERHGGLAAGVTPIAPGPAAGEPVVDVAGFRWPWLTAALVATLVAVFVIEQRFAVVPGRLDMSPAHATLTALGAANHPLVLAGQWYRLLSAPFLHAGIPNLVFDCLAIALSGCVLERTVGRAWMFSIFAAGTLVGSGASMLLLPLRTISLGTSGAVMAMLVSLFLISFRPPAGRTRTLLLVAAGLAAIPALIPVGFAAAAGQLDYASHLGGAVLGGALGLLLLGTWQQGLPLPRFRAGAATFAAVAALGFGGSALAVAQRYPTYAALAGMIPRAEYPRSEAEMAAKVNGLLAAYPRDARSHSFAATVMLLHRDTVGAEQQLGIALSLIGAARDAYPPASANAIRGMLALTLLAENRAAEARAMAREPCAATGALAPAPALKAQLVRDNLCADPAAAPPA